MSKDYANKKQFTYQRKRSERRKLVSYGATVVAVICLVSGMVYVFHAYQQHTFALNGHPTQWFSRAKTFIARNKKTVSSHAPADQQEEIQFDFYTELPSMQVNLPTSSLHSTDMSEKRALLMGQLDESIKTTLTQQAVTHAKKPTLRFILQMGEFGDPVNASELRLSLLLAGIETEIVKIAEHNYRVQQGPYANERQAKSAQRRLSSKGFEGVIKEI